MWKWVISLGLLAQVLFLAQWILVGAILAKNLNPFGWQMALVFSVFLGLWIALFRFIFVLFIRKAYYAGQRKAIDEFAKGK